MADLINLDDSERMAIGQQVYMWVQAGLATQGTGPTWWDRIERFHLNQKPGGLDVFGFTDADPKYSKFHVPLSQPRQDALTAQVCTVIGRQDPYMRDQSDDEDVAEAKQRVVHRAWNRAGFESVIRKAARIVGDTDLAYIKIEPGAPGTLDMFAYHCKNVVVFPALPTGVRSQACIGNRTSRRIAEIEQLREAKFYYKGQPVPQNDPTLAQDRVESDRSGAQYGQMGVDQATLTSNLWDLDVRLKLEKDGNEERWYHCTIDEQGQLLRLTRSKWSRPRWFRCQFIGSATDYYSATSVGRNLAGLQDLYNALWSAMYIGTMRAAVPPMIAPQSTTGEKNLQYSYASYIETAGKPEAWALTVGFEGGHIPTALQFIERTADQVARISQNATGVQTPDTTATESSIIAAGVAVGLEEFIANFTQEFGEMAALTCEMIADDYDAFTETCGTEVEMEDAPATEGIDFASLVQGLQTQQMPEVLA